SCGPNGGGTTLGCDRFDACGAACGSAGDDPVTKGLKCLGVKIDTTSPPPGRSQDYSPLGKKYVPHKTDALLLGGFKVGNGSCTGLNSVTAGGANNLTLLGSVTKGCDVPTDPANPDSPKLVIPYQIAALNELEALPDAAHPWAKPDAQPDRLTLRAVTAADVDGDGQQELVAVSIPNTQQGTATLNLTVIDDQKAGFGETS